MDKNGATRTDNKQGYGNVPPMFALTQVYAITGKRRYIEAALAQLRLIEERFLEPGYSGAFLVNRLYTDMAGYTDRGYLAYNYSADWRPSQKAYNRQNQWNDGLHATPGHGIEFAYLLCRAVERGFDPSWLDTARKLMKFREAYAVNAKTGGMLYEITDYSSKPLAGNPDNNYYLWWPSLETARAFLHFAVARDVVYAPAFKKTEGLIHEKFTDQKYGGLWNRLRSRDLVLAIMQKGDIWKTNFHYAMFMAEALRLAEKYPEKAEW